MSETEITLAVALKALDECNIKSAQRAQAIEQLRIQLASMQWIRVTARDESLPPSDMRQVEMLLCTKTDGDFIAMTTGDQFRRLAASGNPKIKDYYWRPFIMPKATP